MKQSVESKWKKILDNILIYNLYILIFGSIFLGISFTLSVNGKSELFNLFQKDAKTSNCKLFFSPVWISTPTFGIKPNDVKTFALASNWG